MAAYASDAVQSGDPASAPVSPAAGPPVAAPTSTVPTSLQQSFSVLDQSSGSTDSSSDGALVVYGVNRALAQTVDVDGVGPVTVLPGSSGVCIEVPDPVDGSGGSCRSTADAEADGLTLSVEDASGQDIERAGLVPDGIDHVTVTGPSGATDVPVVHNVWATEGGDASSVSFTAADGTHAQPIP